MTGDEADGLRISTDTPEAIHAELKDMLANRVNSWTMEGLRQELDRWERELRAATNARGEHYSADTIKSHIGHSAQFIRWLAGEWQPHGPRGRS
jgi:hypothetical protein